MGTHSGRLVNCRFVYMKSRVLIGSVLCLHDVTAANCECLVNRLFVSMKSRVLIMSVLSIVYLSPWCQGYSLWMSCQSSFCLHEVTGTHWECLVNRLFVCMMSRVPFGIICQLFICLQGVKSTHCGCIVNRLFVSLVSLIYPLGVSCQSSICLHGVMGVYCQPSICYGYTHWKCIRNRLFTPMMSQLLLSCQPRVTLTSCFVYKVIRDLLSIYHVCINPIPRKGLIHK